MAVPVEVDGDALVMGVVEPLFVIRPHGPEVHFDATADGQRFLVRQLVGQQAAPRPLSVLVNWPATTARR
jgi:hypothetical protein